MFLLSQHSRSWGSKLWGVSALPRAHTLHPPRATSFPSASPRPRRAGRVKNSLNCGRCIINKHRKLLFCCLGCCCCYLGTLCGWCSPGLRAVCRAGKQRSEGTANAIETCGGNFNSRLAFISIYRLRWLLSYLYLPSASLPPLLHLPLALLTVLHLALCSHNSFVF